MMRPLVAVGALVLLAVIAEAATTYKDDYKKDDHYNDDYKKDDYKKDDYYKEDSYKDDYKKDSYKKRRMTSFKPEIMLSETQMMLSMI